MTIKPATSQIFAQLTSLLQKLTNEEYAKTLSLLNGASIGQHVRHILEFYQCLLDDLSLGVICYDKRKRDIFIERNNLEALALLAKLEKRMVSIDNNRPLQLEQSYGLQSESQFCVETNLFRELIYNIEHAVHHMALIRIGLRELDINFNITNDFGVASSTVRHLQSESQKA